MSDLLETAAADVDSLSDEYGTEALLNRYGLGVEEIETLVLMAGDDVVRAAAITHGVLLGLALAETRDRETA